MFMAEQIARNKLERIEDGLEPYSAEEDWL